MIRLIPLFLVVLVLGWWLLPRAKRKWDELKREAERDSQSRGFRRRENQVVDKIKEVDNVVQLHEMVDVDGKKEFQKKKKDIDNFLKM